MSSDRLPNQEDLADLRARGKVAVSAAACRLIAGSAALCMLCYQEFDQIFAEFYALQPVEYAGIPEQLMKLGQLLQLALLLFMILFIVSAFLQSRFFFNPAMAFNRTEPWADSARLGRFLRPERLVLFVAFLFSLISLVLIWQKMIPEFSDLSILNDPARFLAVMRSMATRLMFGLLAIVLALLPFLLVVRNLRFRFDNRVKVRQ